ncbi:MAG: PKD domain-containing protein [Anaerolineae bacterium]|nr:PKD domain-containing protein [Anaerolineae bacterium]
MTLYVVSMTTNRVAVVPPDGSQARIYDVAEQLQPYPQRLQPGIVPLQDRILLYRFNPFDRGIDILQVHRSTGIMEQLVIEGISHIVSCASFPHISWRPFFAIDDQHVAICSEDPKKHFNVHVVNVTSNIIKQTLRLGTNNSEGSTDRPWIEMEVDLEGNIYLLPYSNNISTLGIDVPVNNFNYRVKYNVLSQTYSLVPFDFNLMSGENSYTRPVLIDLKENKYIIYTGGTINNRTVDLFKVDIEGNILWHISNPPLPDDIRSMMLLGDGRFAISDFSTDVPLVFLEPKADAGEDQTLVDSDNDGMENITLDGSSSFDRDGTILSYVWTMNGEEIANGELSQVSLGHGVHEITLIVTDNQGLAGHDTVIITVTGTD